MQNLQGKTAVVTGGASGIGLAMTKRFLADGMNVVIGDIEQPVMAAVAQELADDADR
ncbi:MAG: SDR family NAD(P)-dependent oxidoreductase, partial [Actinobacteria bacterium]|nr:SDR family NAD(P)-dependent oxidoreductase [Actinomycetota bacterium]